MALLLPSAAPLPWGTGGSSQGVASKVIRDQDDPERTPEVILREFAAVVLPAFSDGNSPEALAAFRAALVEGCTRQAALALELRTLQPDHVAVPRLMNVRWLVMCNTLGQAEQVDREVESYLMADTPRPLRRIAHWSRAHARLALERFEGRPQQKAIEAAIALDSTNALGAWYLSRYVVHQMSDMDAARDLCERILQHYGASCEGGRIARRCLRAFNALGSKCSIRLSDFRTGDAISFERTPRRPILVHTWSGDLEWNAATLEGARDLHEQYGIDCVGVATFAPATGEAALEAELASRKITWPVAIDVVDAARPWVTNWRAPLADGYFLFDGHGVLIAVGSDLRVLRKNVERVLPSRMPQR